MNVKVNVMPYYALIKEWKVVIPKKTEEKKLGPSGPVRVGLLVGNSFSYSTSTGHTPQK